jgi:pyruvate/2-oxoglutarate dehydrogenase complex dihydrolipoamide dehydrogenase (E3) component
MPQARKRFDYDLVILGGGSAGIVAGNVAGALGARVALVEKERIGGECLWTGCVPSKALLHVAQVAKTMRSAKSLGLKNARLTREDCAGAFAYVREKIEEVKSNDATEKMLRDFGVEIFFGEPRFVGPHLVSTPQGDLRGARFLLATGSSPREPDDIPGLRETGYLTNKTLYDLDRVPESVVFVGGGYIACEMGQALSRLGAKVTILDRGPRLLKRDDAELVEVLTRLLTEEERIEIVTGAEVTRVRAEGGRKVLTATVDGAEREVAAEEIVVSVGRRANTVGLNLDAPGVDLDEMGNVRVDATGHTTAPHVWACGDVTGQYQFSHVAEHEAKILVRNILFPGAQAVPYDVVPWATFTDPELAHVGLTEAGAVARYGEKAVTVLRHRFVQDDRAIVEGRTAGLVKVVTTGLNGSVVGASILGPSAGEMIHEWVIAMRHGLPARAIADLIHVYPTVSVSNQRAAQKWYAGVFDKPLVKGALSRLFGFEPRDASGL